MIRTVATTQPKAVDAVSRILIIEDSPELGELLAMALKPLGVEVAIAHSGGQGIDLFHEGKPDLVLLDIGLPDTTGWRVLDEIKRVRGEGQVPYIVMITAYGDPANRVMGKLQGVDSYLTKPLLPRDVANHVKEWLEKLHT